MNAARSIGFTAPARVRPSLPWLVVTLLGSLACANGGTTLGMVPVPPAGSPVSLSHDVQAIFEARGCTASFCHGDPTGAPMSLAAGRSYANLVNVAACEAPILKRVDPTHSAMSYLIAKLDGTFSMVQNNGGCSSGCNLYTPPNSCGQLMPFGAQTPIDASEIQLIRDWIDQGAQNN